MMAHAEKFCVLRCLKTNTSFSWLQSRLLYGLHEVELWQVATSYILQAQRRMPIVNIMWALGQHNLTVIPRQQLWHHRFRMITGD